MELILDFVANLPTWVWWVTGILFVFIFFGDRELWDYEAKFPFKQGIGRGEIELKCYKKRGSVIEVKLESNQLNKALDIYLNNRRIFTVPSNKTQTARVYLKENIEIDKPSEGDEVVVRVGSETLFQGQLIRD